MVISIIAILVGLAFPVIGGMLDRAKKVQAKNDLTQIVTAITAFYTEYGKYPVSGAPTSENDAYAGDNAPLFDVLRGNEPTQNARNIPFLTLPAAKDTAQPKAGIGSNRQFYDPWGTPYSIGIDLNYDNKIANPYKKRRPRPIGWGRHRLFIGKK